MSAFSNHNLPFVLNSIFEPNTLNYMSSLLREETSGALETCFSSSFPDECSREIPGQYAQNHGAITLDEANLLVPFKFNVNPFAAVKQASDNSTALPVVVELERRGDHQLLTAKVSASENKRKKVETRVEREKKHEKQGKKVRGLENTKESRLKPDVKKKKKKKKVPEKVQTDNYVHVRARRGEATDKHSLAERVRRAKISARMKLLQSLVPGCDKITGKTQILDEIIRYVQFLQHQVESFAAKFAPIDSMFGEFGAGLSTNTLALEEFYSLELPLTPNHLESSSTGQLTASTAATPASTSSLLPQPDRHQRLNIIAQDQNNMLWGMQYQNQKFVEQQYGLDTTLTSF